MCCFPILFVSTVQWQVEAMEWYGSIEILWVGPRSPCHCPYGRSILTCWCDAIVTNVHLLDLTIHNPSPTMGYF
jgi:hypothetical protein